MNKVVKDRQRALHDAEEIVLRIQNVRKRKKEKQWGVGGGRGKEKKRRINSKVNNAIINRNLIFPPLFL